MCVQVRIKLGKLRHHISHQEHQHHRNNSHQQRRIDQRNGQLLLETEGHAPKIDVPAQNLVHAPALLAGHQRCRVDLGKDVLRRKSLRKQLACPDPLADVLQQRAEIGVFLAFDEQIQGRQYWQSRLEQGQELLVKHQETRLLDSPAAPDLASGNEPFGLDPIDEKSLLGKSLADLRFRIAIFHLL